jgi:hypothetical protein
MRVKIVAVRGAPEKAQRLARQLSSVSGIDAVRANPVTGNVLIEYDHGVLRGRDILQALRRSGWLHEIRMPSRPVHTPPMPAPPSSTTGERVLEKVVTALLEIVLLRLFQLA